MKHIQSKSNPLLKDLRRIYKNQTPLNNTSQLDQEQKWAVLEGVHLCQAYLNSGQLPQQVFVDVEAINKPEINDLLKRLPKDESVICLAAGLISEFEDAINGQGIIFTIPVPLRLIPQNLTDTIVLLDRVQDPGNVGSIIRTCAAAGIQHIGLSEQTASAWSVKVLRAAQGAHFQTNIYENVNLHKFIKDLRLPLIATGAQSTVSIYDYALPSAVAWVFGHEGQGVSEELLNQAHETLSIPISPQVESLNVGVAVAICLFEQKRQMLTHQ